MEDEFFEDCYNRMNISEPELQTWFEMGECDKPKAGKQLWVFIEISKIMLNKNQYMV